MAGFSISPYPAALPAQAVVIDPTTGQPVGVPAGNGTVVDPAAVAAQQQAVFAAQQQAAAVQQAQTQAIAQSLAAQQAQVAAAEVQGGAPTVAAAQTQAAAQAQAQAVAQAQQVTFAQGAVPQGAAAAVPTGAGVAPPVAAAPTAADATLAQRPRHGAELWAGNHDPRKVHVTQVKSRYNPTPASGNRDCGPASVVMALRLLGVALPGLGAKAGGEAAIDRVRALAGQSTHTSSTTNLDLEHAIAKTGAKTREVMDFDSVKAAVLAGQPVILNGNPHNPGAYGSHFGADQMVPYNGAHWVTVSGYDESTGEFIVNDPLSMVGPVKVTAAMLDAYRGGSMGIVVSN